ncbi:MAG: hypothetical protein AAFR28_15335 [Pseudomonadota bacterium]
MDAEKLLKASTGLSNQLAAHADLARYEMAQLSTSSLMYKEKHAAKAIHELIEGFDKLSGYIGGFAHVAALAYAEANGADTAAEETEAGST